MKFTRAYKEDKCYNCALVGIDRQAVVVLVGEDNTCLPICNECIHTYIYLRTKMETRKDYRRMLTVEFMADDDKRYDEIKPFLSAMKKIHEDSSSIGFLRRFTKDEQVVLNGLWEKLKDDAQFTVQKVDKGSVQGVQDTRIQN